MALKESYVRARVDDNLKQDSERILNKLGISTTEAIRMFLHQIKMHQGIPFDLRIREDNSDILLPNATRSAALDSIYDD